MSDETILGYSINQMKFINGKSLSYQGVHPCYVNRMETHKKSKSNSSRSMYHLELMSKDEEYKGILYVEDDEYDRAAKIARTGKKLGDFSIVTSKNGTVRFSKELSEELALKEVKREARKITIQSILVIVLFGIPTISYMLFVLSLF